MGFLLFWDVWHLVAGINRKPVNIITGAGIPAKILSQRWHVVFRRESPQVKCVQLHVQHQSAEEMISSLVVMGCLAAADLHHRFCSQTAVICINFGFCRQSLCYFFVACGNNRGKRKEKPSIREQKATSFCANEDLRWRSSHSETGCGTYIHASRGAW